ncbi:MAG: hypothetical protein LBP87_12230 [Planctomycetaceae bacterium]|jgi:Mrp family chromosome partitioning ATPase|nr:hypothetical protein [Planctomycetaceae bacterium]
MSVIPEPISRNNEGQSDSIISHKPLTPEESFLLPSILRGAAYISSGGRVYRLFSDNDEISFPIASFEKTLQLDPLPEISPVGDFVSPLEDISKDTAKDTAENISAKCFEETLSDLLPDSSIDSVMNSLTPASTPASILQSKQQSPALSINELNESNESATESVSESVSKPVDEPVDESAVESVIESITKLVSESCVESCSKTDPKSIQKAIIAIITNAIKETVSKTPQPKRIILPKLPLEMKRVLHNETYKFPSEMEREEPTNTNTPTPLYQRTQEKITLKLFDAFPELTISSDSSDSSDFLPANADANANADAAEAATSPPEIQPSIQPSEIQPSVIPMTSQFVAATPIVRMIRLEVPLRSCKHKQHFYRFPSHHEEKTQHSPPTQYETAESAAKSVDNSDDSTVTSDHNIDRVTLPIDTELVIPTTTESSPESSSLSESQPNTLLFPVNESLAVESEHSQQNDSPQNNSHQGNSHRNNSHERGTWRLIWQSHWPEYLKSLELAASDQICFLADHLEIQKEQKRSVISFNSFQSGDGCTTLALCAARELAERGYRLLLVDAHRQNPELPQLLHLETNPDVYEIITLIPDRLELLPWSGTSIEIDSQDHITQSFAQIVASFREHYDFILLDNGSLVECPFAERVSLWRGMYSDGVLLVLNMKRPPSVNIQTIAQRLFQNQINLLGIVENYV